MVLMQTDAASGLGPGTVLRWNGTNWWNNSMPVSLSPTTPAFAYRSAQSSVYAPAPVALKPYDTVDLARLDATPLVSRTPGTTFTSNQLDTWTRIKGAAGRFIKQIAIPCGIGNIIDLFNPATGKMVSLNTNSIGSGSTELGNTTPSTAASNFFGWSRLSLAKLAPVVLERLGKALGGNV